MSESILEIENLQKSFGNNHVLRGVSLTIPRGSITTILGKSGTGKSVLLKCIAGLMEPDGGTVRLGGQDVIEEGHRKAEDLLEMSYLFQGDALFESMSARENVALPLLETTRLKREEILARADQILEQLDLSDAADRSPADLSGGMRRRVSLARALITKPELVLFDEPTSGLDPVRRGAVLEMILRYKRDFGFTALMVSHDIPESIYISDEIALLEEGSFVFCGTPTELDADNSVPVRAFLDSEVHFKDKAAGLRPMSDFLSDFDELRSKCDQLIGFHTLTGRSTPSLPRTAKEERLDGGVSTPGIMRHVLEAVSPLVTDQIEPYRTGPSSFCLASCGSSSASRILDLITAAGLENRVEIRVAAMKKDQDIGYHLDTLTAQTPLGRAPA